MLSTVPSLLTAGGLAAARPLLRRLIGGLLLWVLALLLIWRTALLPVRLKDKIKAVTGPARLRTQQRAGSNTGIVRTEYYVDVGGYEFQVNEHEYAVFIDGHSTRSVFGRDRPNLTRSNCCVEVDFARTLDPYTKHLKGIWYD